jgi:hypothetical protein
VTVQVTPVLLVPCTVALNCCFEPGFKTALSGDTVTLISPPVVMVTVAEADIAGFDNSVAVTLTLGGVGAVAGAV